MRAGGGTPNTFGKDAEPDRDTYSSDGHETASETSEKQAGVKRIEAVSKSWTTTSLVIAYVT
jgi:SP family sugar:H+ symporter-like MFS transporter